jgi:hypothetical protein
MIIKHLLYKGQRVPVYMSSIHYTPQVSRSKYLRSKYAYRDSFLSVCSFFSARRLPIAQVIVDNDKSDLVDVLFVSKNIAVEYVPPGDHRTNPAERAIYNIIIICMESMIASGKFKLKVVMI